MRKWLGMEGTFPEGQILPFDSVGEPEFCGLRKSIILGDDEIWRTDVAQS